MTPESRNRIRAIVLTTQRTGSTFLIECLASHPDIETAGEILIGAPDKAAPLRSRRFRTLAKTLRFVRSGAWMPARRMEAFFSGGLARVRVFKAMYNHLSNPFALEYLRRRTDIKILHLRRYNLLKMYVSQQLMSGARRVQSSTPIAVKRIRINPADALAAMRRSRRRYEHFEALFGSHARLQLRYEELINAQSLKPAIADSICDFLEVGRAPMRSQLIKVNPDALADIVVNYDEVASAVSDTEFADLLDS
jgi:hypothetical protein